MPVLDPEALPELRTARLLLRRPTHADMDAVCRLAGDREVARWMSRVPHPYAQADAVFFIEEVVSHEPTWMIQGQDGAVMGAMGLTPHAGGDIEFGYWLGRAFWREGFATEAGRAVLRYAFEVGGVPSLVSGCFAGNARSMRVLEKLGFVIVGRSTRHGLAEGRDLPHVDMRLAYQDWAGRGEQLAVSHRAGRP